MAFAIRTRGYSVANVKSTPLARIDATPASEPPWQIPARPVGFCRGHVVDSRSAEWLTAQQPRQRHPSAGPQSETPDRFIGIDRAGRQMPAVVPDQRRERVPVEPDHRAAGLSRQSFDVMRTILAARGQRRQLERRMLHGRLAVSLCGNCLVPMQGTPLTSVIVPQFYKYQRFARRRNKGSMDDSVNCVYVS